MSDRTYYLPWPPGVNAMHRAIKRGNFASTILSERGRIFYEDAHAELLCQKPDKIKGPVSLIWELKAPTRRKYDPDKRIPPAMDALVKADVIEDDNNEIVREQTTLVATDWPMDLPPGILVTVRKHGPEVGGQG